MLFRSISKNELKDLFELINNSPKNWDDQEHLKNMKKDKEKYNSFWSNRLLIIENNSTMKSINDRIHSLFDLKKYEVHKFSKIMRYFPGDSLALHNDDGYSKEMKMSIVFYLNDDYNGGEIYFDKLNFNIKQRAGSMLIFPSNEEFTHCVKEIQEGPIRYVSTIFIFQNSLNHDGI